MRGNIVKTGLVLFIPALVGYAGLASQIQSCNADTTSPKKAPASAHKAKSSKVQPKTATKAQPVSADKDQQTHPYCDLSKPYSQYVSRLQARLYPTWDQNTVTGKNHVVLEAIVGADGSVSAVNATSTPNNPAAEEAATSAFNQMQPLEALPAKSPPAKIIMNFDSTYDPHGDSNSTLGMKIVPMTAPTASQARPSEAQPDKEGAGQSE